MERLEHDKTQKTSWSSTVPCYTSTRLDFVLPLDTGGRGKRVRSKLCNSPHFNPTGGNDRLMTLKLPLHSKKTATLISAYAPTMTNPNDIKEKFYQDLHSLTTAVPKAEKLIILGNL
ncbi:hypothetical protein ElyMa_006543700 [Elysia marginata]|uniref:Endonuclease/exonuclease/phosphatase domain-containing protein n=1 Tax=Elysia marginata TaxID=1093978 RepID=A0AAV4IB99_9GAST|nr:hypothetical protein ElyMa_006543700 [Elysia marginata]